MKETIRSILRLYQEEDLISNKTKRNNLTKHFLQIEEEIKSLDFIKRRPAISIQNSLADEIAKVPWILLSDLRILKADQRIGYCVLFFAPEVNGFYVTFCHGVEVFDAISNQNHSINSSLDRISYIKSKSIRLAEYGFNFDDKIDFQYMNEVFPYYKNYIIAYKFYSSNKIPNNDYLAKDIKVIIETYEDFFAPTSNDAIKFYSDIISNHYPRITLSKDNWDDFTYKTLYAPVYYYPNREIKIDLGSIKILQRNQKNTQIKGSFESLEEDFCSLGQDIDYYKIIASFDNLIYSQILSGLNDIVFKPDILDAFRTDEPNGFEVSLFRFSEAEKAYKDAPELFREYENPVKDTVTDKRYNFTFSTLLEGADKEHIIDFDFNDDGTGLNRINVLIGRNATGKTQVLAQFANAMSGWLKNAGTFSPSRPNFSKVIAVSYSIFDQFERPIEDETFSYKYCGLRSNSNALIDWLKNKDKNESSNSTISNVEIQQNLKLLIDQIEESAQGEKWVPIIKELIQNSIPTDRDDFNETILSRKEIQQILKSSLLQIEKDERSAQWNNIISELFHDSLKINDLRNSILEDSDGSNLRKLSSGQSFLILVLTEIIANIKEESVLLIDEPETHLHPDALTAFARALHLLLKTFNSFAIVATHSPIILQEIPSKRVRVFERDGNITTINHLGIECFGENLTTISDEVFKSSPTDNNYFKYFEDLSEKYTYVEILNLFNNKLSFNAKAYLTYLYSKKS